LGISRIAHLRAARPSVLARSDALARIELATVIAAKSGFFVEVFRNGKASEPVQVRTLTVLPRIDLPVPTARARHHAAHPALATPVAASDGASLAVPKIEAGLVRLRTAVVHDVADHSLRADAGRSDTVIPTRVHFHARNRREDHKAEREPDGHR